MERLVLFLGLTFLATGLLLAIQLKRRRLKPSLLLGLFLFGIWLSVPFVIVENLGEQLKYYFMILSFIGIEGTVVLLEHKWKYLHHLIHHNVKSLRLLSYFVISAGFAYSELIFYVLHSQETLRVILMMLPFKAIFALFVHTVITSSTALINATESTFENIFLFLINYLRLVFISVSHYLYLFILEHKATYLLIPFLILNIVLFFRHKKYLEGQEEGKGNTYF
jgi:hypothetical protein